MKPKNPYNQPKPYGRLIFRGETLYEGEWGFLAYQKSQMLKDPTIKPSDIVIAHLKKQPQ